MLASEIIERAESGWHVDADDDVPRYPFPEPSPMDSAQRKRAEKLLYASEQE